jgi:cytochrome P450
MLEDELFKNSEVMMIDECITFLLAGTQTTATLVQNVLFYLTVNKAILDKCRL